jgi:hypothetical protein
MSLKKEYVYNVASRKDNVKAVKSILIFYMSIQWDLRTTRASFKAIAIKEMIIL